MNPGIEYISPVHPIFHWSWSPKNNLSQHCSTKPSPTTTSSTACWLGTLSTEWIIACIQTAQTNCIRVQKHTKLYNNSTPLKFNQATPNANQMIACVCAITLHPARHNPSLIWGRHWALKYRSKPRYKNSANLHSSTKHSLYNNPTPLEFNQATPNAYHMIALCLCNNMTASQTQPPLNLRETLSFERQG